MKPGTICVIVRKDDGHVLGWGADFERGGAAGFSRQENQERRARLMATQDFIRKHSSELLLRGIDNYLVDRIIEQLRNRKLIEIQTETVGDEKGES